MGRCALRAIQCDSKDDDNGNENKKQTPTHDRISSGHTDTEYARVRLIPPRTHTTYVRFIFVKL